MYRLDRSSMFYECYAVDRLLYCTGLCVVFLVHEFRKLYESVKNKDRENVFERLMLEMDMAGDDFDKKFVISEQRKKINRLEIKNCFHKRVAKHYKELYLWRENR